MKKLRTIIEIVANNRSAQYKQFKILKVRLRLVQGYNMLSSNFFSVDELPHVMLTYYNFLYNKSDLNTASFNKYFNTGEAYFELGEMSIEELLASQIQFSSFELEYLLTSDSRSTLNYLIKILNNDASNSKYSFNANIYLSFADVSQIESEQPIEDINLSEIENFILYRALERNYNSPIAQEEYMLEELENLYPSRPYNKKRKTPSTPANIQQQQQQPSTSRQANLRELELSRIEDILEKELEDDDDASRAKRGKGIAEQSRLLDNLLSKYFN